MSEYFPFIHEKKKKKEWEPESLHIEYIPPPPKKREEETQEETDPTVIIIQL